MEQPGAAKLMQKLMTLFLLSGCLVLFSRDTRSTSLVKSEALPTIVNKTRSVEVTNVERYEGMFRVTLTNSSNKDITAITVSFGKSSSSKEFLISDDENDVWKPNTQEVIFVPIPTSDSAEHTARSKTRPLVVNAVVFANHTSEGDPKAISTILNFRLGYKLQLQRIVTILSKTSGSSKTNDKNSVNNLRDEINSIQADGALSEMKTGLQGGKGEVLREMDRVKQKLFADSGLAVRAEIENLKKRYNRKISRL